jgi:DNA-directed RNA polymerase sigma subunit (sigma70/sigma32)
VTDPAVGYETEAVKQAVHDLVAGMPEPLNQVITVSYGLNDSAPVGVRQIGARLGLSRDRARQLRQEALVWLRHPGHSAQLRTWLGRHQVSDYEQAYQQAQAWRQWQRRRHGR